MKIIVDLKQIGQSIFSAPSNVQRTGRSPSSTSSQSVLMIFLETPATTGLVFLPCLRPPLDLTAPPCLAPPPSHPFKPRRPPDRAQAAPAHHTPMIDTDALLPRRRQTATAPHSTTWPWVCPRLHRPPQLLVSGKQQEDRRKNGRRTQHCQQKEVLLFPYSCKSYVSAHTVFIPRKKLVERFLLHLLRDTKCTRFPPFYYFTFARGQ